MRRLLDSPIVDQAMRGAALVVTDRRWAAPLSAAALGFGIFAGVAIGPGAAGTFATGAQQIIEIPASSEGDGQSGGGGGAVASTGSPAPLEEATGGSFEEAIPPTVPLAPESVEPAPAPEPAAKPAPTTGGGEEKADEGETQELKGTVAYANPAAGSYALAIAGGELVAIHARELPEPGLKLSAPVRRLANGTFTEAGEVEREKGRLTQVEFRGAVTFADPDPAAPTYTVSGRGSSLPVQVEPDPSGVAPELPPVGAYVSVTTRFEEPEALPASAEHPSATRLIQGEIEIEPGPPSTYLDLAGVVREVTPEGTLLFSAEWTGEKDSSLSLSLPPAIEAKKLTAGDSYLATAEVAADGSLTLKGIASDEQAKGADDPAGAQGDLRR